MRTAYAMLARRPADPRVRERNVAAGQADRFGACDRRRSQLRPEV